uniref:Phycobiliprotein ApcE n=1 Tax=Pleurostichidium falkenbergii TaxID=121064 RepID=A0A4D6UXS4_9FLOR|nr:phycobilisome linker polypeptide [Pleurostichidium falkenbergii]QCH39666.1 phycobilisome linker polypeptide [Pleurostichidium falkenbergii]
MIVKASGGSPLVKPKLYRTVSLSSILQAEQQDRFLQLGELNQLVSFFSSGNRRLEIAKCLTQNADFLVSRAADKIFVGGSSISYLERPQSSFLDLNSNNEIFTSKGISGNSSTDFFDNISSTVFDTNDPLPPGFKPINIVKYGSQRMKKSLRDLDWFLRYLTYSIISGDSNILSVNIRGLRELIDSACSSAAAIVALREMRKLSLSLFDDNLESKELVKQYFDVLIVEFESSSLSDKLRKRFSSDVQGLRLPQVYNQSGVPSQKFVMKSSLSTNEKLLVISACYRQVFERDIAKAYSLQFKDLESQVKIGKLSIKEFVRFLGKSSIYKQEFSQPFSNSRVIELSFKHFLGRGVSSIQEFQKYFALLSSKGINGLTDELINSEEYTDYFAEETVPYLRKLGEEAQESRNWGPQLRLFNYSAVFRKIPEFITLFADYQSKLSNQHPYGLSNDPLAIQFGAIFPKNTVSLKTKSSFFTRDTRRLLVKYGPGIFNQISSPNLRGNQTNVIGPMIFSTKNSLLTNQQIILAIYLRVFGRFVYSEELSSISKYENKFRSNLISVKEFIRLLVKSVLFRSLYWDKLYICKAIEYLHIKLIGRPTYSRQEIDQYFNIVYKKSYYDMIDQMLNSSEYNESFGSFVVPYERYVTSAAVLSRGLSSNNFTLNSISKQNEIPFINLSQRKDQLSFKLIKSKVIQGVTSKRDQSKLFILNELSDYPDKAQILRASYRQIFERDLFTFSAGNEFYSLEKDFMNSKITVKQLIERLVSSNLYRKEFYEPYPNTKVIELCIKHILGRAPNNQAEIRYYNQILASRGLYSFASIVVNSSEYRKIFGANVVPYRRFPTLPAANFPNTEKLYNSFTKQNLNLVVPSFKSISSY